MKVEMEMRVGTYHLDAELSIIGGLSLVERSHTDSYLHTHILFYLTV